MMYQVDLSRFSNCTIRPVKIVNLMRLKEFRSYVDSFDGEITDEWVVKTAIKTNKKLFTSPKFYQKIREKYGDEAVEMRKKRYRFCHNTVRYLLKEYPQYV